MHPHAALSSLQRQPPCSALATSRPPRRRCTRAVHAYQQGSPYEYAAAPAPTPTSDVADIVSFAKRRLKHRVAAQGEPAGPVGEFMHKVRLAWRIFFPEQPRLLTPKEEGKHRLRMILVADRVGMNEVTMEAMRERIIGAVSPYVEIESPDLVEVAVTTDVDLGAIYSVAVPVRRVKPAARVPLNEDGDITFHWDPSDENADPSSQFPFGT